MNSIGIDVKGIMNLGQEVAEHEDVARKCKVLQLKIKEYQESFTAMEKVTSYNLY